MGKNKHSKTSQEIIETTKNSIRLFRGQNVIVDSDLASIYGVETKRLNEQVKRNRNKFPDDFMFQLTNDEYKILKSQNATTSSKWGGRRKLPYVFAEHGVLQAANVINSDLADSVSVFVIRAFVEMRKIVVTQQKLITQKDDIKIRTFFNQIKPKIYGAINNVLGTVIDTQTGLTVKNEAQDILVESINNLKEKLKKTGLENEEIAARIIKILAEVENQKAAARKTNAESEQLEFMNIVRKLKLILESQKILMGIEKDSEEVREIESFISILKDVLVHDGV